jgi:hypothetical protein
VDEGKREKDKFESHDKKSRTLNRKETQKRRSEEAEQEKYNLSSSAPFLRV